MTEKEKEEEKAKATGLIERYVDASEGDVAEQVLTVLYDNGIDPVIAQEMAMTYQDLEDPEE